MKVYLDHSATTPLDKSVLDEMLPYFIENAGNANSLHYAGRAAAKGVDKARDQVANALGAKSSEIYFTSGGTESDNWALKGIAKARAKQGKRIVISCIEHAAMLASAKQLERDGFEVVLAPVDEFGIVDLKAIETLIDDKTILVSVMLANNEIGTIQPVKEIARLAHAKKALMHTDAVQAIGSIPVNVKDMDVDLLSLSGHKFYGPKGIGVLYKKTGIDIESLIVGGHQEKTKRGGTTNVPLVVGIGAAIEKAITNLDSNANVARACREYFLSRVLKEIPKTYLNGHSQQRLPGNANISFDGIEGEGILQNLDILSGVCVSTGSACSSGSLEPSHVLLALGVEIGRAHSSTRFSFGKENTIEEVDYVVDELKKIVKRLRDMSPLWNEK